jgi:hypothetical protein|eukprot:g7233.t1 g7233   contig24:164853-165200(-)
MKVFLHLFPSESRHYEEISDIDINVMPDALAMNAFITPEDVAIMTLYHMMRHWNVYRLFSFPSPEMLRILEQMNKMLDAIDAQKDEIELLKKELNEAKHATAGTHYEIKRRRTDV